jgi:alanine racemase
VAATTTDVRHTVARVDLDALRGNVRAIRGLLEEGALASGRPAPGIIGVVKANAYGHGAAAVARVLESEGVAMLACADVDEGIVLRDAGVETPILVFGALGISELEGIFSHRLTPTISSPWAGRALADAAAARQTVLGCHVKIDTGMNRLGLRHDNLRRTLPAILEARSLRVDALYTHFATADEPESELLGLQQQQLVAARAIAADLGLRSTRGGASRPPAVRHRPATADDHPDPGARPLAPQPHRRGQGRA